MLLRHLFVTKFHPGQSALVEEILEPELRAALGLPRLVAAFHRRTGRILQGCTGFSRLEPMPRWCAVAGHRPIPREIERVRRRCRLFRGAVRGVAGAAAASASASPRLGRDVRRHPRHDHRDHRETSRRDPDLIELIVYLQFRPLLFLPSPEAGPSVTRVGPILYPRGPIWFAFAQNRRYKNAHRHPSRRPLRPSRYPLAKRHGDR